MIHHETAQMLRTIALFRELNPDEIEKIGGLIIRRELEEKTQIFHQGDPLDTVYFIVSGQVKIFRNDDQGREQVVNILQIGDLFPHAGFFQSRAVYPAHSVMLENGVLLALSTTRFRALIESNPALCLKLMSVMESQYLEQQGRLTEMVMHNTFGRLVLLLVRLSRLHGVRQDDGRVHLSVPLTNQDLASMIGTSRETVNRTISQLKKSGVLEITQDHIMILSPEQLEKQL
ncbi:Crp/Fnr family transcriptional regulator [Tumebacillus sp. DT12]|uniref:Crp/Fnr family transcriptional regulator n=1 Tax=Tumebacillus lacus TaxID=2995335 RepID=A0ABT3WZQ1_9BACL|nr:Crp/Fnr family transcriptional regulator [Tumebacillus lacus]MCX7570135.1 Crp/Fnr family transcriptional regulator [Tumebacillus lacus]